MLATGTRNLTICGFVHATYRGIDTDIALECWLCEGYQLQVEDIGQELLEPDTNILFWPQPLLTINFKTFNYFEIFRLRLAGAQSGWWEAALEYQSWLTSSWYLAAAAGSGEDFWFFPGFCSMVEVLSPVYGFTSTTPRTAGEQKKYRQYYNELSTLQSKTILVLGFIGLSLIIS